MRAMYADATQYARFGEGLAVMHVQFAGQSFDVPLLTLKVRAQSPNWQVRLAVARYLALPDGAMECYEIERHSSGNVTIRPRDVLN